MQKTVKEQADECILRWKAHKDKETRGIIAYSQADIDDDKRIASCDFAAWMVIGVFVGIAIGSLMAIWCLH